VNSCPTGAIRSSTSNQASSGLTAPRVRFAPSPTGSSTSECAHRAVQLLFARGTVVSSCCASRTPDVSATVRSGLAASSRPRVAPDGARQGPFRQSARQRHRVAIDALFEPVSSTPATAPAEAIAERTKDNPTPGYDGYCRSATSIAVRPPPCASNPHEGSTTVGRLDQGEIVVPTLGHGRLRGRESTGSPSSPSPTSSTTVTWASPTSSGARTCSPPPPPAAAVAALDEAGEGRRLGRAHAAPGLRPPADAGRRSGGRSSPSARTPSPSRTTATRAPPRAFRKLPALLAGARRRRRDRPVETLIEQFRLEDVHHRAASST